ncbi:MAG: substrate-binding domain-containing protein [Actinomycetota bacterium]|nr:substrate-binding domain-containing protein [Actinomycetota bacterium]
MHRRQLLTLFLPLSLLGAACAQETGSPATTTLATVGGQSTTTAVIEEETTTSAGEAAAEVPEAFAEGEVRIALVRQLGAGDYFEQWQAGAVAEAERLNVELEISNAEGDNAQQALDLQAAINAQVDAIAIDHGFPETMQPPIGQALEADIPVVAFDVDPGAGSVPTVEQSDHDLARLALEQLVADTGGEGDVIYVYVAGFAPLDRRNEVWEEVKEANPGLNQVAQIGVVNESIAASVADQAKAALQANPETVAVFAPFDEFAKGAVLAIRELGMQDQVKVYGADISTADIAVMTEEGSPWVATAATDPANVGAVTIRAAAMLVAGEEVPKDIIVPPILITQQELREKEVDNMEELREAFPQLSTPDLVSAPWMDQLGS